MRRVHRLELTGQRFGKWTVQGYGGKNVRGEISWLCRCDCGSVRNVIAGLLTSGYSTSCRCNQLAAVTTHGMTGTRTFRSWESMKQRCLNPKAPDFDRYGGRGISICAQWVLSFDQFLQDMGERPAGMTIDRKDHNGNYTPDNCRWATRSQQQSNRRSNITLTCNGESLTITDWSERTGISTKILRWRLARGWNIERALSEPIMEGRGRKRLS